MRHALHLCEFLRRRIKNSGSEISKWGSDRHAAPNDQKPPVGQSGHAITKEVPKQVLYVEHSRRWIPDRGVVLPGVVFWWIVLRAGNNQYLARMEKAAVDRIDRHQVGQSAPQAIRDCRGGGLRR